MSQDSEIVPNLTRPQAGIDWSGDAVAFTVWAPQAERVELVVGHPDGEQSRHAMERVGDDPRVRDNFRVTQPRESVSRGTRYGYSLDNGPARPDPRTRWQPDGVHRLSAIDPPERFDWRHAAMSIDRRDLVLYELHVGTFTSEGTFDAAIARLPDLVELGVTAVEVLPVSQFPGDRGWGYDGVHPFAVQNTYGGPDAFRRFIDAAHGYGLGVLLDVVYNHFGPEGNYLGEFGPYLTGRYRTPWGDGVNYDGAGCDEVRRFVCDNVRQWIGEYRLDGLRLDAIQTIFDVSARHILSDIAAAAREAAGDRTVHIIGETDQNDVRIVTPCEQNGLGLDAIWNDDLHHALHSLVTGERDVFYADFRPPYTTPSQALVDIANKAFSRDGRYCDFRGHSAGAPAGDVDRSRLVVCIQNHDQAGNRALGERLHELCPPAAYRLSVALLLLSPQTPLLFQGEEYAEPRRFPFFCDFEDPALNDAVRRGRAAEYWPDDATWTDDMPDPPRRRTFEQAKLSWDWSTPDRAAVRRLYRTLLAMRRDWPRESPLAASCEGDVLRMEQGGRVLLANLSAEPRTIDPVAAAFSTEQPEFGGRRDRLDSITELRPWEVVVV